MIKLSMPAKDSKLTSFDKIVPLAILSSMIVALLVAVYLLTLIQFGPVL